MHYSDHALLGLILPALIFIGIGSRPALGSSCSFTTSGGFCALLKITIQTDAEANGFVFPNEKSILLIAPNVLKAWKILFNRFSNVVEEAEIQDGFVPEIYIKETLTKFSAYRNLVQKVTIEEKGPYTLKFLTIANNQLRSIPENINKLTNLVNLYLNDNEIRTVNMDHFKNMTRLEVLSLSRNRITRIDTTIQISLPNLVKIFLQSNCLEKLSVELWNFTNLKVIKFDDNKLTKIESFWGHFPNLTETWLGQNQWSCTWLEQTLPPILNAGKITVYGGETCPEKSFKALCCYDSIEDVKNALEKLITKQFEQISTKLERAVQLLDDKILKLDNKLDRSNEKVELQHSNTHSQLKHEVQWVKEKINENRALIDDVVEDLYLEELKKREL